MHFEIKTNLYDFHEEKSWRWLLKRLWYCIGIIFVYKPKCEHIKRQMCNFDSHECSASIKSQCLTCAGECGHIIIGWMSVTYWLNAKFVNGILISI